MNLMIDKFKISLFLTLVVYHSGFGQGTFEINNKFYNSDETSRCFLYRYKLVKDTLLTEIVDSSYVIYQNFKDQALKRIDYNSNKEKQIITHRVGNLTERFEGGKLVETTLNELDSIGRITKTEFRRFGQDSSSSFIKKFEYKEIKTDSGKIQRIICTDISSKSDPIIESIDESQFNNVGELTNRIYINKAGDTADFTGTNTKGIDLIGSAWLFATENRYKQFYQPLKPEYFNPNDTFKINLSKISLQQLCTTSILKVNSKYQMFDDIWQRTYDQLNYKRRKYRNSSFHLLFASTNIAYSIRLQKYSNKISKSRGWDPKWKYATISLTEIKDKDKLDSYKVYETGPLIRSKQR
jgi:hypothetical protein